MKLKVLGTRGEIKQSAPSHHWHSGTIIDNMLMDLGESAFLKFNPEMVFITHLHPDHAFFVSGQLLSTYIPVYAPESFNKAHSVIPLKATVQYNGYIVTPIPTHHSKLVKSQAYLVYDGKNKLLYTGDLIWIDKEYHHLLAGLDLVITDGSYFRQGGLVRKDKNTGLLFGHNGIPDLVNLFGHFTNNILFVHFGSWFFEDIGESKHKIKALAKNVSLNLYVGYDGMELDLKDL
jgi:ribonuclease BN (tRNA processing enzyme)